MWGKVGAWGPVLSRRDFLAMSAGAGALISGTGVIADEFGEGLPTHRFRVRRSRDLLNLEFTFVNFEARGDELVALGAGQSLVIVRFPPQNLAEATFNREVDNPAFEFTPIPVPPVIDVSPEAPVRSYLSGPSWVVFIAPERLRLPYRDRHESRRVLVDRWLRTMAEWKIRIPRNAETPSRIVTMPRFDETALEIPFRLWISPSNQSTAWVTSSERLFGVDVPPSGTHELWHASLFSKKPIPQTVLPEANRLRLPSGEPMPVPEELRPPTNVVLQARAVFSPDYRASGKPPGEGLYYPGDMPLSLRRETRHSLVKQMAAGDGVIDVEHLVLSALGADASLSYTSTKSFDEILRGQLKGDPDFESGYLHSWKHRIVVGRDVHFIEVDFGFLFPFVYPALAVKVTKRRFVSHYLKGASGAYSPPGAYLLTERFILVVDPAKDFTNSGSSLGRRMPLKSARLRQVRSPLLADWEKSDVRSDLDLSNGNGEFTVDEWNQVTGSKGKYFIPRRLEDARVPGADGLRWGLDFVDESGGKSYTEDACLLFAPHVVKGRKLWQLLHPRYRNWSVPAQKIAFAPEKAEISLLAPADTTTRAGQPVQAGQVLFSHLLTNEERIAARTIADVLRTVKSEPDAAFQNFKTAIENANGDVSELVSALDRIAAEKLTDLQKRAIGQLRSVTVDRLKDFADLVDSKVKVGVGAAAKAREAYEDLLRQLNRAEQVTSTLETHVLAFDCGRVDQLYENVKGELARVAAQATSATKFYDDLRKLKLDDADQAQKWGSRIAKEVELRLGGLTDWGVQKREIIAYVDELKDAVGQAEAAANQFFHAQIARAEATIPALKSLGKAAVQPIQHLEDYVAKGMGELGKGLSRVQNGAFARLTTAIDQGQAMADAVKSAVARPAAIVAGLSRDLGALTGSGPEAIKKLANQVGNFKPEDVPTLQDLKSAIPDAKLFNVLPLRDIIKVLTAEAAGIADSAKAIAKSQLPAISQVELPDHFEQVWEWTTPVESRRFGIFDLKVSKPNGNFPVCLHISSVTRIDAPKVDARKLADGSSNAGAELKKTRGTVKVHGLLGFWDEQAKTEKVSNGADPPIAFSLLILGMIDVPFYGVTFSSEGAVGESPKTSVKPRMAEVQFLGPLKFVATLQEYLAGLLGDSFKLTVTPQFVAVRFNCLIPPITVGVVSIFGIALGAGLKLSFTNEPLKFSFNFSSFTQMFGVAVLCFGGRGFFQVDIATDGSRDLQGAIEFGGCLNFSPPAAKGELFVGAGFYFSITNAQTDLSGYLRACGCLNVLGLLHASVEFILAGRHRTEKIGTKSRSLIYGICTISVSIDLFLLSFDVSITMEKKIDGSESEDEPEATALNGQSGLFHLVSYQPEPAPQAPPRRWAYFRRRDPAVRARFDFDEAHPSIGIREWDAEYWSQFSFND